MTYKEKIIAYIDKLLGKYPKNYYLLMVAEFIDSLQEEPVSKDLEEAANDYAHDLIHDDVFETFIAGALWQKEQMIKDAYTGIYDCCDDTSWIGFKGWLLSTSEVGKKVKLVIIKEE